jgi:cytochrome c oxidase cbb3-type subunit I
MAERTVERERPLEPGVAVGEAPAPLTGRAARPSPFPDRAARHWLLSSIIWLTVVDLFGGVLSTEFVSPDAFGGISWLAFSRVRQGHVNGVILAWLTMMYFGALFYMLPRLCGTRGMWSERLGVWCAWAWNAMYVLGVIALLTGHSQGREYGELIWPLDIALLVIWCLNIVNIIATVQIRTIRPIYVTVWWFLASPLWLAVDYAIGNVIWRPGHIWGAPSGALSNGLADAMLNWWYAHNLFGLWLTPMLVALTLYMVPRITNTPLYSYTLSLVSFWGIAFFYTGVGDHHILQSPTPAWLKTIATASSWMLLVPVFAFTINILGTMKGNWDKFFTNLPLRFTLTAFFFYWLVNIQGAFQALQPFNRLTHFTNFVVAHAHLALLGAFTILGMGVIDYIVAQVYARPLWSRSLTEWQYWLVTAGFTGFFSVLTLAGFQQGFSWAQGIPEVNVLPQLHAYFIARGIFGGMIIASGVVQMINVGMTMYTNTHERRRAETLAVAEAVSPPVPAS